MISLHRGRYRRLKRTAAGVAFIYFTLLGIPVVFFGAGLAVDFTRIVVAQREVTNAVQAAALAGAEQYVPNEVAVDFPAARTAAVNTYCVAQSDGVMRLSTPSGPTTSCQNVGGSAAVTIEPIYSSNGSGGTVVGVTVTARYTIKDLVFSNYFTGSRTAEADPIVRSATLCIPGAADGPTNGYCVHPSA